MTEIKYNIYGVERSVKIPEGLDNIDYSIIEPNNNDKCIKTVAIFGQKMLDLNKSVKENIEWMRVINNDKIGILEGSPYILWFKNECTADDCIHMPIPYETVDEFADALEKYFYN